MGLLEALACGALLFRLRRNAAGRASLRAAAPGVAVLAGLALATLGVSVLLVTVHAYLSFTTVGNTRVGSLQPRYFFPQVLLAIAVAAAVARGALCPDLPGGSVERGSERLPLIGRAAFLGLVGVLLSSFVARVSVALLTRYS